MRVDEPRTKSTDGDRQPRTPPGEPTGSVERAEAGAGARDGDQPVDFTAEEEGVTWTADQDSSYWIG
jgi:hypothetical protein